MYFVCFFFFKQKTAYEMRISDWSSDVCSSDLGHTLTATAGAAPGTPVFTVTITDPTNSSAGYTFTLNGPLDHDGTPSLGLNFVGVTVTDSDGDSEHGSFTVTVMDDAPTASVAYTIGKASCRERVCQYV